MMYMLAVMPAVHSMTEGIGMAAMGSRGMGSTGTALPALTWAFIGYFLVFVVQLGARLAIPSTTGATEALAIAALGSGTRGVVVSPHLLGSSELVMAIGMSYMLLTML
jgi:hypothetical protein